MWKKRPVRARMGLFSLRRSSRQCVLHFASSETMVGTFGFCPVFACTHLPRGKGQYSTMEQPMHK